MTSPHNRLLPVTYFCLLWILYSCNSASKPASELEGKIIYSVTFPFEKNSVMLDLYPKELIFHFKDHMMHTEIRSSYDLLTTDLIIDNQKHSMTQLLKNMSARYAMTLDNGSVADWLGQFPEVKLENTVETETIAGYVCNKTIAYFVNDTLPPMELYHTRGLGIACDNWWNIFDGVDGFLMGYDVEQYGKRMRLRATEVKFESVDDKKFQIPDNFIMTDAAGMNEQLMGVVSEFMQ